MTRRELPPSKAKALRESDDALDVLLGAVERFLKLDEKFSRDGECPSGYVAAHADVKRAVAQGKKALRWCVRRPVKGAP